MMRSYILVAVFVVPTVAFGVDPPASTEPVAATVNGQAITVAELDAALNATLPPHTLLTPSQRKALRAVVIDDLVEDLLLKQFLAKSGPKADPAEIEAQMKAFTARLKQDGRTFEEYLKETGKTEAQLRGEWTVQIQLAGYVKQQVTDEQLKAHYAANRDVFDRVEVRISHIVVRANRNLPGTERAAAKEKLQAIRADLLAGKADFATAAKKFSQCPSAKMGGDLGFFQRRGLPENEPLAKAAFALKVGTISDVIETDFGYHILTITERKAGTPSMLEKCVVEVLEDYTDSYRAELVTKLRKEGQVRLTLP